MKKFLLVFLFLAAWVALFLVEDKKTPMQNVLEDSHFQNVVGTLTPSVNEKTEKAVPSWVLPKEFDLLDDRIKNHVTKIKNLQECFLKEECKAVDGIHPKNAHYEISMAIKWQVIQITETLKRHPELQDSEIEKFAQEILLFPEDHVKEVGFDLIAEFPESYDNLEVILAALEDSGSGDLYEKGLDVLTTYAELGHFNSQIVPFLIRKIRSGGASVSKTVSQQVYPFITKRNYGDFFDTLRGLRKTSVNYRSLKAQLRQFQYLHPEES